MKLNADGKVAFTCPVYGGTILAENIVETLPQMATVRGGAFKKGEMTDAAAEVIAESVTVEASAVKTTILLLRYLSVQVYPFSLPS